MDSKARRVIKHMDTAAINLFNAAEHIRYNKHIPNEDIQALLTLYRDTVAMKDKLETKYYNDIA